MDPHDDRPHPALSRGQAPVARVLVILFVVCIGTVPVFEWMGGRWMPDAGETAWSHLAGIPARVRERLAVDAGAGAGLTRRVVVSNRAVLESLEAFEDGLEDQARIGRLLRPPVQLVLSARLGVGNERVYVGRDGWLFYRPEVEFLTGPGFLDPAALTRRAAMAREWATAPQPDPRPAIIRFARQLEARGITLVVMPTPLKPTVHPERLARGYEASPSPLHNPSSVLFTEDLRRAGVLVFDATDELVRARRETGRPQFLATDTHWRPEAMAGVAEALAAFLRTRVPMPALPGTDHVTQPWSVTNAGDTAAMLDLPGDQRLYPPETVATRRVLAPGGTAWRPSRSADVLVLGDSFSNIYSLASMGWGDSAGFAEQLSHALGRPIDRIVQNDNGAYATRLSLRRMLAAGEDRLAGKRVVIYQFAARELAVGDWRMIDLPEAGVAR
jgi:alginate O-acetyltransferase complex protein AlgJ